MICSAYLAGYGVKNDWLISANQMLTDEFYWLNPANHKCGIVSRRCVLKGEVRLPVNQPVIWQALPGAQWLIGTQ